MLHFCLEVVGSVGQLVPCPACTAVVSSAIEYLNLLNDVIEHFESKGSCLSSLQSPRERDTVASAGDINCTVVPQRCLEDVFVFSADVLCLLPVEGVVVQREALHHEVLHNDEVIQNIFPGYF